MTEDPRTRFRDLPEPTSADDWVETTDTARWPIDADRERRETQGETMRAVYLGAPLP